MYQEDQQPLYDTMRLSAEVLRVVAGLLYPVMPAKMDELRQALGMLHETESLEQLRQARGQERGWLLGALSEQSLLPEGIDILFADVQVDAGRHGQATVVAGLWLSLDICRRFIDGLLGRVHDGCWCLAAGVMVGIGLA